MRVKVLAVVAAVAAVVGNVVAGGGAATAAVCAPPEVSVADTRSQYEGSGGGTKTVALTVTMAAPAAGCPETGSVGYRTVDGSAEAAEDYVAVTSTLTWAAPGSQVVELELVRDDQKELDESFIVKLFGERGVTVVDGTTTVGVLDDDASVLGDGVVVALPEGGICWWPSDHYAIPVQLNTVARAPVRAREFGRHGAVEPAKYAQLGFSGVFTPDSVPVDRVALKDRLLDRAARIEATHRLEEVAAKEMALKYQIPAHLQIPTLTSLDYRIERVKCADETNPEWPGDDEIAMGGVAVGHNGATTKVNQFMVRDDFDDNEVKVYTDPGKLFHRFDLTGAGAWPRTYSAVVMLAEKDGSGFADAINTVWSKVKDDVLAVIDQALDGLIEDLEAALAEAVGEAVAWLVNVFFDWLFELFQDDLFDPGTHYVYLPNRYEWMYKNASDYGWTNFRLPTGTFTFNGHGGSYKVNVHWQVNP